jgi:hypothetical protein
MAATYFTRFFDRAFEWTMGVDLKPLLAASRAWWDWQLGSVFDIDVAYREDVREIAEDLRRDSRFADNVLEPDP